MRALYQKNLNVLFWQVYLCLKLCLLPVLHYPTSAMLSLKYYQINSKTILVLRNNLRFFSYKTGHAPPFSFFFFGEGGGGRVKKFRKVFAGERGGGQKFLFWWGGGSYFKEEGNFLGGSHVI